MNPESTCGTWRWTNSEYVTITITACRLPGAAELWVCACCQTFAHRPLNTSARTTTTSTWLVSHVHYRRTNSNRGGNRSAVCPQTRLSSGNYDVIMTWWWRQHVVKQHVRLMRLIEARLSCSQPLYLHHQQHHYPCHQSPLWPPAGIQPA